jgi:quercetin dioxygenase-like cupin family protein
MLKRHLIFSGLFATGIITGLGSSEIIRAQQAGGLSTKLVYRIYRQNIPGQEVLIYAFDWPSGFRLPLHMHPEGHEFVYVMKGEQTFEIEGIGTKVVKAGEVIYTPPNTPHFGRNATERPSKTVVFRVRDKEKPITVEVKS